MKRRSYTLIELMVVIAIVGLLVGVAVPNYQSYMVRTRVATAFNIMKYYAHLGEEYYEAHGAFGNAQALGLNTVNGQPTTVANPTSINPNTSAQIVDVDGTAACYNNIRFTFNGTTVGAPQDFDIQMVVRPSNGMYEVTCGIPWDQNSSTYANVLQYFPESCSDQNVSSC